MGEAETVFEEINSKLNIHIKFLFYLDLFILNTLVFVINLYKFI